MEGGTSLILSCYVKTEETDPFRVGCHSLRQRISQVPRDDAVILAELSQALTELAGAVPAARATATEFMFTPDDTDSTGFHVAELHAVVQRELMLVTICNDRGCFAQLALDRIPSAHFDQVLRGDKPHYAETVHAVVR